MLNERYKIFTQDNWNRIRTEGVGNKAAVTVPLWDGGGRRSCYMNEEFIANDFLENIASQMVSHQSSSRYFISFIRLLKSPSTQRYV